MRLVLALVLLFLVVILAALLALTMVGGTVAISTVTSEPGALPVVLADAMISSPTVPFSP